MADNYNKYIKYKTKYLELIGGGKNNKYILVDGTSSSGKSTICKYFSEKDFLCYQIDSYWNDKRINFNKLFKKVKNDYGGADKIFDYEIVKYMVNDAVKTGKNVLFDHVSQKGVIHYMTAKGYRKNLYIIVVFANLDDMARNLESRRKAGDQRGVVAFKQFSDRYIKCADNDTKKIETINRGKFKKILLKYFKYEFKNENDLIRFSNEVFADMNIMDDNDHYIKLRDEYKCDYLLITTNKTKQDIFDELNKIIL